MTSSTNDSKSVVLVLLGVFRPGNDSTGPNTSFKEQVAAFSGEFTFKVVAEDRAVGARRPEYPSKQWIKNGDIYVRYLDMGSWFWGDLYNILNDTDYDVLMMNGFFDRNLTIPAMIMRRLGAVPRRPAILSTRGELAQGALSLKAGRKRAYLRLASTLGLHSDVFLHASDFGEAQDIKRVYPFSRGVLVASDIHQLGKRPARPETTSDPSPLRLVFLGRIARVKNLDFALRVLGHVRSSFSFDIFGPIQEADYWNDCLKLVARLEAHAKVSYRGEIPNSAVSATLAGYDLLFLPTLGENFGHAILDALAAGVPVLISDRTPFKELQQHGAGWSIALSEPRRFVEVIEAVASMNEVEREQLRTDARRFAERRTDQSNAVIENRSMLLEAMSSR